MHTCAGGTDARVPHARADKLLPAQEHPRVSGVLAPFAQTRPELSCTRTRAPLFRFASRVCSQWTWPPPGARSGSLTHTTHTHAPFPPTTALESLCTHPCTPQAHGAGGLLPRCVHAALKVRVLRGAGSAVPHLEPLAESRWAGAAARHSCLATPSTWCPHPSCCAQEPLCFCAPGPHVGLRGEA